jgi:chromosome segregation ATPase
MSPTGRPQSLRKRQSSHIIDLESRLDQTVQEHRLLQDAHAKAQQAAADAVAERDTHAHTVRQATDALAQRDVHIKEKEDLLTELRDTVARLENEVQRLAQVNAQLTEENQSLGNQTSDRFVEIQQARDHNHGQWQASVAALAALQMKHDKLSGGMEGIVRDEIGKRTVDQDAEIERLNAELRKAMAQIKQLQQQILTSRQADEFLTVRDEDYFDTACQQLCTHVQQWVVRFSKFSDTKQCRLSSDIKNEKIEARLDDAILDGSDVDMLLADRTKRRDVFMSVVMSMIWEYVFTRYLFGMDKDQRQKLKSLEKTLTEVGTFHSRNNPVTKLELTRLSGPQRAVAQWRAITLTLLSRREAFQQQREQDTEAVVQEIFATLARLLPPPSHLKNQVIESLRKVMLIAVDLSIQMRTQRAEYIMLPPLRPEYDTNGDLVAKVTFNAALMNERSGDTNSNEGLEQREAVVKIVLFPLVVKKGDDNGEGEDEIVVCPAQVLVQKQDKGKKVVRVMSGAMDIDARRSVASMAEASMAEANA